MNIALLEDDEISRMGLSALLKGRGTIYEFSQGHILLQELDNFKLDLAFIDLDLEEELLGLEVVNILSKRGVYCVILTGHDDDATIAQGYEVGAKDYLVKPVDEKTIDAVLHRYKVEEKLLFGDNENNFTFLSRDLVEKLRAYSFSHQPILITGESGTGKTLMAENIYKFLQDINGKGDEEFPFVSMNCSEFNESLIESELFGHVSGAFTGATKDKVGRIESANGGILFIDEIGAIPEFAQRKLLKVLDEHTLYRVGDNRQVKVDFILMTATCENLEEYVKIGKFREDLYHRINGLNIELPAFRNLSFLQKEELVKGLLEKFKRKMILTTDAKLTLFNQHWSGNIRELKRFLEKCNTSALGIIDVDAVLSFLQKRGINGGGESAKHEEVYSQLIKQVEELGLPRIVSELESYMINHFYNLNQEKSRKTINQLKISNNLFYKYIKKS